MLELNLQNLFLGFESWESIGFSFDGLRDHTDHRSILLRFIHDEVDVLYPSQTPTGEIVWVGGTVRGKFLSINIFFDVHFDLSRLLVGKINIQRGIIPLFDNVCRSSILGCTRCKVCYRST